MSHIIALERFVAWLKKDFTPTERSSEFIEEVSRQINQNTVQSGTGSPEGVISAEPTTLYMDDSGTAGSILYVKKTGAGSTGWILV